MAHIKIGMDINGNKTATLKTDAGSFTKQVNVTAEMGSAFRNYQKGDVLFFHSADADAVQTFINLYKEIGTERQKQIIAAVGGWL